MIPPVEGNAPGDREPADWQERVASLEGKLAARDRTIAVLIQRQLSAAAHDANILDTLEQNALLGKLVARKTRELAEERAQLQETLTELRSAQTRLLQVQKLESIGQLAAGIAHEINTPTQFVSDNITFLRGALEPLFRLFDLAQAVADAGQSQGFAPDAAAAFQAARDEADLEFLRDEIPQALLQSAEGLGRIATIVKAMKNFAHTSGDGIQPENLQAIVETASIVSRAEWKSVAELHLEADPNLPPVPCLRDEIGQLVLNLLVNSAHAIQERIDRGELAMGEIVVSLGRNGQAAELRVADNGAGIPESIRDRVFDPFFTTKPVGVGSGQGLALAYSTVVERHKGQISFESEPGRGTCFLVRLPL
jgi:signal transduction histidine kinase